MSHAKMLLLALLSASGACADSHALGPGDEEVPVIVPHRCEPSTLDLNGDEFDDLVVPVDGLRGEFAVYLGSPTGLSEGSGFVVEPSGASFMIGFALGNTRGTDLTDLLFVPYQTGAAETCWGLSRLVPGGGLQSDAWINGACEPLSLGDVDGDGFDDVFLYSLAPRPQLYFGGPDPFRDTVTGQLCPGSGRLVPAGDVTGDGTDEVVCVSEDGLAQLMTVGRNGVATPIGAAAEIPAGERTRDVLSGVGDVNGDGYADVVTSPAQGSSLLAVQVLAGSPEGLSGPRIFREVTHPDGAILNSARVVGDVNGDGAMDFSVSAISTPVHPESATYLSLSHGLDSTESTLVELPHHSQVLRLGDVNCDGFADIATRIRGSIDEGDVLHVLHGTPSGFSEARRIPVPSNVNGLRAVPATGPSFRNP